MKTISILLALVVVLGFVSEAGAGPISIEDTSPPSGCTFDVGECTFGLVDWHNFDGTRFTVLYFGPLGASEVPFTATQGLTSFIVILAMLIILPIVALVAWRKKRAR